MMYDPQSSAPPPLGEDCEVLEDIRVAEEQVARGEGVEHDEAKEQP